MIRAGLWMLIGGALLLGTPDDDCHQLQITVAIKAGNVEQKTQRSEIYTTTSPAGSEPQARTAHRAKAGDSLQVHWTARNADEDASFQDVYGHFYVVKEEKLGQEEVPDLAGDVVHEGVLTMDFKPGEQARGAFTLRLEDPGVYLIRVETLYLADRGHGHDHFAAMDLVIE